MDKFSQELIFVLHFFNGVLVTADMCLTFGVTHTLHQMKSLEITANFFLLSVTENNLLLLLNPKAISL